jgi:glycosyltransferase involved in cell wall biosynthesis
MTGHPAVVHVASGREWRGGQRQVCYLTRALRDGHGLDQVVVTGRGTRLAAELHRQATPVAAVPWGPAFDPRALAGLLHVVRAGRAGRLVLHAHDSHALALATLAAAWRRTPLVATRRVDFHLRRGWIWRRADAVVAISRAVQRILLQDGLDPARVTVVYSGIPLEREPPPPPDLRARLGLSADASLAVSVGALARHKDHATLLAAAACLREARPQLHWIIAGDGVLRSQLERRAGELGLAGRVHFLGPVPDGRAVIAAADLLVVSSREEGLNTSVLDAMALGVPVVATDAGGIPELLGDDAGLLAPREDPPALAALVARALTEKELRDAMVTQARITVQRFSAARMAAAMLSVYDSVAQPDPTA